MVIGPNLVCCLRTGLSDRGLEDRDYACRIRHSIHTTGVSKLQRSIGRVCKDSGSEALLPPRKHHLSWTKSPPGSLGVERYFSTAKTMTVVSLEWTTMFLFISVTNK